MNYPICRISVCLIKDSKGTALYSFVSFDQRSKSQVATEAKAYSLRDKLSFVTLGKLLQLENSHSILKGWADEFNKTLMNLTNHPLTDLAKISNAYSGKS